MKFLTGMVFISGLFIGVVGLMLVNELKAISSSREVLQSNWMNQHENLTKRMDDLSSKVEMLLLRDTGRKDEKL